MSKASNKHLLQVYKRSDNPKHILQLLQWVMFEPILLSRFSQRLEQHEIVSILFRLTPAIIIFSGTSFLIAVVILQFSSIVFIDTIPPLFEETTRQALSPDRIHTLEGYSILLENSFGLWLGVLAAGLAVTMHRAVLAGQQASLLSLLPGVVAFALLSGLITGFSAVFTQGWQGWILMILLAGLAIGIQFFPQLFLLVFRLYLYPIYMLQGRFYAKLTNNPYLRDGYLWYPIWGLQKRLLGDAFKCPNVGLQFAEFLFNYRPIQHGFAAHIVHAATAGQWHKAGLASKQQLLQPPVLDNGNNTLVPSVAWIEVFHQLQAEREKLQGAQESYQPHTTKRLRQLLHKIATLARTEWDMWYQHYAPVLASWEKQLNALEQGLDEQTAALASKT